MVLGVGLAGAVYTSVLTQRAAAGSATAMYGAIDVALLVACGVAVLGALTAANRGR